MTHSPDRCTWSLWVQRVRQALQPLGWKPDPSSDGTGTVRFARTVGKLTKVVVLSSEPRTTVYKRAKRPGTLVLEVSGIPVGAYTDRILQFAKTHGWGQQRA